MVPDISPTTVALFQLEQFSTSCLQNLKPETIMKMLYIAWHIMGGDGGVEEKLHRSHHGWFGG